MATAYTSLLGLALPVTGELSGTWGDTVNNSITSLLDSAIAGTTTLSSDADVTLTTTTGASNTSRQAILLWTAGGTVTRNITAPAQSKIYTVINKSSSTQSIVLRGVGPTTGVTIVQGESAVCAWNGSDFIKISNTSGAGVFTTLSASSTVTLSGGTANGVAYLNGSKVLTTGSALVFDGSNLGVGVTPSAWASNPKAMQLGTGGAVAGWTDAIPELDVSCNVYYASSNYRYITTGKATLHVQYDGAYAWYNAPSGTAGNAISLTQAMTLNASGNLGIGTSSPSSRLTTSGTTGTGNGLTIVDTDYSNDTHQIYGNNSLHLSAGTGGAGAILFRTGGSERARIDSSGNLGLGVTPVSPVYAPARNLFIGQASTFIGRTTINYSSLGLNHYEEATTSVGKFINASSAAAQYYQYVGNHVWQSSTNTPTANGTIVWNSAMTLDASGKLQIASTNNTGANAKLIVGTGNVGTNGITVVNTGDTNFDALVLSNWTGSTTSNGPRIAFDNSGRASWVIGAQSAGTGFDFCQTWGTPYVRIDSSGNLLVGKTAVNVTDGGFVFTAGAGTDQSFIATNIRSDGGGESVVVNRQGSDGTLIDLRQANTSEGTISVSGTTVSYNGGHLSRWAQTTAPKDDTLVKGTVLSNLDEMNVYTDADGNPVDNEQLNKVKVSDTEGDVNVAGVFVNWSYDEQHSVDEINMAMTGDMIIRIAQGVTVARGDLLMSAGDGTAKPQGDDIVRSKTVAKVTSNHVTCTYEDGSYCVPCVLMAC